MNTTAIETMTDDEIRVMLQQVPFLDTRGYRQMIRDLLQEVLRLREIESAAAVVLINTPPDQERYLDELAQAFE